MTAGTLLSVNVGIPRTIEWCGRQITTAIYKEPVVAAVMARGVNIDGDAQADLTVHGGIDKAVYAYAREDLEWWSQELGRPVLPGTFGENLTVAGLPVTSAVIGERWRIGELVLESVPSHGVTVGAVSGALLFGAGSSAALRAPELPDRARSQLLKRTGS